MMPILATSALYQHKRNPQSKLIVTLLLPNSQFCVLTLVGLPIVLLTNFFDHEHKMAIHQLESHVERYEIAAPQSLWQQAIFFWH